MISAALILDVSRHFTLWTYGASHSRLLLVSGKESGYTDRIALFLPAVTRIVLDTNFMSSGIFAKRCGEPDSIAYDFYFNREQTLSVRAMALYAVTDDLPINGELDTDNGTTAWRAIVRGS